MRRIPPLRTRVRTLAAMFVSSVAGLQPGLAPAQDEQAIPGFWPAPSEHVHLQVENITSPGQELQKVVVTYVSNVRIDIDSIDGEDIWVASRNGYNEVGRLVEVHELPLPADPAPLPADPFATGGGILPHLYFAAQATYAFAPGTGDSWSTEDNGLYAVILQRGQVRKADGTAFASDLLGYFGVRVGEPIPALPVDAEVTVRREQVTDTAGETTVVYHADLRVTYRGDDVEVTSWGTVRRVGDHFVVDIEAYRPAGSTTPDPIPAGAAGDEPDPPLVVQTFEHSYRLGRLGHGEYKFTAVSFGERIAGTSWVVPPDVEPVPAFPEETSTDVYPLPVIAIVPPPPAEYVAEVKLHFEPGGVEIESWGDVTRQGNTITAEVLAVRRPDITPDDPEKDAGGGETFRHRYDLGTPTPGSYRFVLTSRGRTLGVEEFTVPEPPDPNRPPAQVALDVVSTNSHSALIRAYVAFVGRGWELTDPGEAERVDDFTFVIDATAEPTPDTPLRHGRSSTKHHYLSPLKAGEHTVIFRINGFDFERVSFEIVGGSQRPHIRDIEIHEGNASYAAEVFVLLPHPEIGILSWGNARREGNRFFAEIVVGPIPDPVPLPPDTPRPDGVPWDFPGYIVSNFYNLGALDPGGYAFHVTYEGEPIFTEEFKVPPTGDDLPPKVEVRVENIEEPKSEPHLFTIQYSDRSGLDLESIKGARVVVVNKRLGFEAEAELLNFATPPAGALAAYAIGAPGGTWDARDRGRYSILVDPEAIRDLQGNHIDDRRIGRFKVDIWPEPPGFPWEAEVEVGQDPAGGIWNAKVAIELPEELAAPDDWEIDWGEVRHYGHVLVALARYHKVGEPPVDGPGAILLPHAKDAGTQTVRHEYELGALRDGRYLFVFLSNLGHFGKERFNVGAPDSPGAIDELMPFEAWQAGAFEPGDWVAAPQLVAAGSDPDGDRWSNFEEYAFGFDPLRAEAGDPEVRAEIVEGEGGASHLGVRYHEMLAADDVEYRILGSADLNRWDDVTDLVDFLHREPHPDGKVDVLACLRARLGASPYRYLKVMAIPADASE